MSLSLKSADVLIEKELGGEVLALEESNGRVICPVGARCYLKSALSKEVLLGAFENAELI